MHNTQLPLPGVEIQMFSSFATKGSLWINITYSGVKKSETASQNASLLQFQMII